jgi:outer membrane protein assembly factor BamB
VFKKGKGPSTPVLGERIAVLTGEGDVAVDPAVAATPMNLPQPAANSEWTQSGGNSTKSMGHLALRQRARPGVQHPGRPRQSLTARLGAAPIVAGGRVFTIDTLGSVRAFDAQSGAQVWSSQTPTEKGNQASLYGGGIAYDKRPIYATNGLGFVAALDERTGGIVWQVASGRPAARRPDALPTTRLRHEPGQPDLLAQESDGSTNWSQPAALGDRRRVRLGAPRPSARARWSPASRRASSTPIATRTGRMVWQDALQRTSIRTSVSSLSDIDADAVIDRGQVIAIGQGGRMVALEITTGQRLWELNIAGISTPWVAGDWIFVITDDAKLLCVYRQNGHIRWINQLPAVRASEEQEG